MVTDSIKTMLAKLKYRNPVKYRSYLQKWNVHEEDIRTEIKREEERLKSLNSTKDLLLKDTQDAKPSWWDSYVFVYKGKKYERVYPISEAYKQSIIEENDNEESNKQKENSSENRRIECKSSKHSEKKKTLCLVDGDNLSNEEIEDLSRAKHSEIRIYIAESDRYNKLKGFWGKKICKVKPGNQAVDNRIKSEVDKLVKKDAYESIIIISHDKGYDEYIREYKLSENKLKRIDDVNSIS